MPPTTDEKTEAFVRAYTKRTEAGLRHFLNACESPIERLFLAALFAAGADGPCDFGVHEAIGLLGEAGVNYAVASGPCGVWRWGAFVLQPRLKSEHGVWRPDFGFVQRGTPPMVLRVAVELDGHDFHERTKAQATRDKSRDRDLNRLGWRVLRFTGSEIYADAEDCVSELAFTIDTLLFPSKTELP